MHALAPIGLILLLAILGLGAINKNGSFSPAPQPKTTESSESAVNESPVSELPDVQTPAQNNPAGKTTSNAGGSSYTSTETETAITMSGTFNISTYKNNFTFTVPKNGGEITGTISGTCEGTISGNAEKPNSDNISTISGSYSGGCKPIPALSYKTPASGTYTGAVKFNDGAANVIYDNKAPIETRGSLDMFF